MAEHLLRAVILASIGLAAVLLLRRPARRAFGAGPAFTLWALPLLLAVAPWIPLASGAFAPAPLLRDFVISAAPHGTAITHAATHGTAFDGLLASVVTIWLAGVVVCLARSVMEHVHLRRGVRPLPPRLREAMHAMCPAASDLRRLRVHAEGPAVMWGLRTRVLLPPDFLERFDASARAVVLRHELTHARRGDAWWTLAAETVRALLWFHPFAWWALPRFRLDMELACDERALRTSSGGHVTYGRALLASHATHPQATLIPWLAAPQLRARIAMIARIAPGRGRRMAGLATITTLAAAGLFASSVVMGTPRGAAATRGAAGPDVAPSISFAPGSGNIYPTPPFKKREHGKVVLYVTGDASGTVVDIRLDPKDSTAPLDMQQAMAKVARKWKITPGRKNGKPVGGTVKAVSWHVLPSDEVPCKKATGTGKTPHRCYSIGDAKMTVDAPPTISPTTTTPRVPDTQPQPPMMMPLLVPPTPAAAAPHAG